MPTARPLAPPRVQRGRPGEYWTPSTVLPTAATFFSRPIFLRPRYGRAPGRAYWVGLLGRSFPSICETGPRGLLSGFHVPWFDGQNPGLPGRGPCSKPLRVCVEAPRGRTSAVLTEGAIKSGPLPQEACMPLASQGTALPVPQCCLPNLSILSPSTYRSTPSTATAPDSLPDICHPLMQLRNGGIYAIPNRARGIGASTRTSRMCSLSVAWAHTHHLDASARWGRRPWG